MSAFICGPDHFIALAVFATHRNPGSGFRVDPRYVSGMDHPEAAQRGIENLTRTELATLYANVLYAANIRSVLARYPNDTLESAPGLIEKPEQIEVTHKHVMHPNWILKSVQILKMCDCLEYQSNEADDWKESTACNLLNAIRRAAVRALPGYDDAPWDYDAPAERRAA